MATETEEQTQSERAPDGDKYKGLIEEQLRTTLIARDKDIERIRTKFKKELGESRLTCETLSQTVAEQSETLGNRQKIVEEFEGRVEQYEQLIDTLELDAKQLGEVHERVKADAVAAMQRGGDPLELANAIDQYSLAVARISTEDSHPMVVVTLIQMAAHVRTLPNYPAVIGWLCGNR